MKPLKQLVSNTKYHRWRVYPSVGFLRVIIFSFEIKYKLEVSIAVYNTGSLTMEF